MTYLNACPGTVKQFWGSRTSSTVGRPTPDVERAKIKTRVYELRNEHHEESSYETTPHPFHCHSGES
jgi:hypothetical protein